MGGSELNLHGVCEISFVAPFVVAIACTTGEVKNANIASDYPRCRNESAEASVSLRCTHLRVMASLSIGGVVFHVQVLELLGFHG